VAEGQIDPAGGPRPVLAYAGGVAAGTDLEWRQLPDGAELIIPPPPVGRQIVAVVAGWIASALILTLAAVLVVLASPGTVAVLLLGGVAFWALCWWIQILSRLVRVARHGTMPTVVRTSPHGVTLASPWLPENRPYRFPRASVTGILVAPGGSTRLIRFLRLNVVLRKESVFSFSFPWRGEGSVTWIQSRLFEALPLDAEQDSPAPGAVTSTDSPCESSS